MSVIRLKKRLSKMSDSQISEICKRMKFTSTQNKKRKIKQLLSPLMLSYSFDGNINVEFTEKKFPIYNVTVTTKLKKTYNQIEFEYDVCNQTFPEILSEIYDNIYRGLVFQVIFINSEELCRQFSKHVNNIKKVCKKITKKGIRNFSKLANPVTCKTLYLKKLIDSIVQTK